MGDGASIAGRCHPGTPVVQATCRIRLVLNDLAVPEQSIERIDLIKEQDIVNHVLAVSGQLGQGAVVGNEAKTARNGSVAVDQSTIHVLFFSAKKMLL